MYISTSIDGMEANQFNHTQDPHTSHNSCNSQMIVIARSKPRLLRIGIEAFPTNNVSCRLHLQPVERTHASERSLKVLSELRALKKGIADFFRDDGGMRIDGRALGKREEMLDVVVAVFERAIIPR